MALGGGELNPRLTNEKIGDPDRGTRQANERKARRENGLSKSIHG